ncbi:MAG: class I SAM-dependent methyltransferase [Bacteroidetes bacterium]|nr:class I SAM-dependent methyltransferase [Bacteroidota bacterium]
MTNRLLMPRASYFLFRTPERALQPISSKYGFDRGKPIERYYIESFLEENKGYIKGRCLEVQNNDYTMRFGGERVARSDILDIDTGNKHASIYGDLRELGESIPGDTYDCLVVTQTLGMIDDYGAAIRECHRILKPGGTMLVTGSAMGPMFSPGTVYWRMTPDSARYTFGKCFDPEGLFIRSYGNVLAGQCYWVGLASDELTTGELEHNDPRFPIITAVRATKQATPGRD